MVHFDGLILKIMCFVLKSILGNVTIPKRVSTQVVFHTIPNKLVLEVSSEGEYDNIVWNRGAATLGASLSAPAKLSEFTNFFEIFVREPTTTSDYAIYDIFYSGAAGIGITIAVVSPGKLAL